MLVLQGCDMICEMITTSSSSEMSVYKPPDFSLKYNSKPLYCPCELSDYCAGKKSKEGNNFSFKNVSSSFQVSAILVHLRGFYLHIIEKPVSYMGGTVFRNTVMIGA